MTTFPNHALSPRERLMQLLSMIGATGPDDHAKRLARSLALAELADKLGLDHRQPKLPQIMESQVEWAIRILSARHTAITLRQQDERGKARASVRVTRARKAVGS